MLERCTKLGLKVPKGCQDFTLILLSLPLVGTVTVGMGFNVPGLQSRELSCA